MEGGNINIINVDGNTSCTPLIAAAEEGHLEVAKLLIKHKADIYFKKDDGEIALHVAANNGRIFWLGFS